MKKILIKSPAKINLALDILERSSSGYHHIQTVFHEVSDLYDEIEIKGSKTLLEIKSNHIRLPLDDRNTVIKAAKLLQEKFNIKSGLSIYLNKKIPVESGLGGGSSNAAVALKALNELWHLDLPTSELLKLAAEIGMDVPFFIIGKTALGTHFGEQITPLPYLDKLKIKIFFTDIVINTCEAYGALNLNLCGQDVEKTKKLLDGIKEHNYTKITANMHNDFEFSIIPKFNKLQALKKNKSAFLCGSGGAMFVSKHI